MAVQTDHRETTSQPHSSLPFTALHMAFRAEGREGGMEGGKAVKRDGEKRREEEGGPMEGKREGREGRKEEGRRWERGRAARGGELARETKCR